MSIRSLWAQSPQTWRGLERSDRRQQSGDNWERADVWSELADLVAGLGAGRSPEAVLADGRSLSCGGPPELRGLWSGSTLPARSGQRPSTGPASPSRPRAQLPAESEDVRGGAVRRRVGSASSSSPARSPEPATSRLVREVATAAASLVHTLVVREALRHHVAEATAQRDQLRDARSDLVSRQNAERQGVASDIHDGCQQRVTVIAGKIGLIRALVDRAGPDDTSRSCAAQGRGWTVTSTISSRHWVLSPAVRPRPGSIAGGLSRHCGETSAGAPCRSR